MYVYKQNLALNNQQWLICYKIPPTNQSRYHKILSFISKGFEGHICKH